MKKIIIFFCLGSLVFLSCQSEEAPQKISLFKIEVIESEGGKVFVSPSNINLNLGDQITITHKASEGWVFKKWEGDVISGFYPYKIKIDSDLFIKAIFVRKNYILNLKVEGKGEVIEEIELNYTGQNNEGDFLRLTPIPEENWKFIGWKGEIIGNEVPVIIQSNKTKNITAIFRNIENQIFFLDDNGITCKCPEAQPGEKGFINGIEYEAVDNELIRKRRDEKEDMTKLCTSLVTDMSDLFIGITDQKNNFNQSIGNWDVSNVTLMKNMFFYSSFNQPIDNWDVSNVINMEAMFDFSDFNKPLEKWDVSNVTKMAYMFEGSPFNQPIENWNVSKVKSMEHMFSGSNFNHPIGIWNVSNVTNMDVMFNGSPFNQNISKWCVTQIQSEPESFSAWCPLIDEFKPKWGTCPN